MSRHRSITKVDVEVWNFIYEYKMCHNGNSPSLQDIVNGTSLKSRGGHVTAILQKLEDAGYLKYYGIRQIEMSTIYLMNDRIPPTPTIGEIIQ